MRLVVQSARGALTLLDGSRPWKWALLVATALGVAVLEALGAGLVFVLIGLVTSNGARLEVPLVGDVTSVFPDASLRSLQLATAALVAAFFFLRGIAVVGQQYLQMRIVQRAGADIASRLVRGYLAMPYLFHTQRNSAELVRNAFDSAERLASQVMTPIVNIMAQAVLVVGLTAVLLLSSPVATAVAVLGLGGTVWLVQQLVQPRLKVLGEQAQFARNGSIHSLQQALGGFRDIRLLSREMHFAELFRAHRVDLARSEYSRIALGAVPRTMIETSLVLIIVVILVLALVAGDAMSAAFASLSVFAYVGLRLQPSLQIIVTGLNDLRFGAAVLDDLREDFRRTGVSTREGGVTVHRAEPAFQAEIAFRGVSFSYGGDMRLALRGVDLTIQQGEFIGICGPTGGGKSTIVDLLVGLLEPSRGAITVDGRSLDGEATWWQAQLGVVSQNVFLLDDTIRANIAFGRPDGQADEVALAAAVERAQLAQTIAELPEGLDTRVGERGVRLSGGQRQRVAIARALYREPSVIVFDEGTSALDSATEAALVTALDHLREQRTLISVAHRISTLRRADRIFVIDGGQVTAQGTFDDLVRDSPLFRSLAR